MVRPVRESRPAPSSHRSHAHRPQNAQSAMARRRRRLSPSVGILAQTRLRRGEANGATRDNESGPSGRIPRHRSRHRLGRRSHGSRVRAPADTAGGATAAAVRRSRAARNRHGTGMVRRSIGPPQVGILLQEPERGDRGDDFRDGRAEFDECAEREECTSVVFVVSEEESVGGREYPRFQPECERTNYYQRQPQRKIFGRRRRGAATSHR
mmetsp:Transcript_58726/g.174757  ORF Transcript_58726/g.174757 Transcript_58726/m.174757 type:complete len:210 (-) Transcript_58726:710-1339(-)